MKSIKDLLLIKNFPLHFFIVSIVQLALPNIISRIYSSHSNQSQLHGHKWYLNFDGIHYFYNNYLYEPNHAFLPLFVKYVQGVRNLMGDSLAIAFLMVVNKIAFIVAAADLYQILLNLVRGDYRPVKQSLVDRYGPDEKFARMGILMFLYNPAGIFFNVIYTESLFCLFTFKAVRYILESEEKMFSTILLTLSVALRSNGMFLAPTIGLTILKKFFTNLKADFKLSFQALIQGISIIVLLLVPFVAHNVLTYLNICESSNHQSSMCSGNLISFYGSVQQKYWNVGFLKYYHPGNIVFIIIGTPAVLLGALGLFSYEHKFNLNQKGLYLSFVILFVITAFFTNIQSSTRFFCGHPFFYYILAKWALNWRVVRIWSIFYWLTGILMYVVSFPWT